MNLLTGYKLGKCGVFNRDGKTLLDYKYEGVSMVSNATCVAFEPGGEIAWYIDFEHGLERKLPELQGGNLYSYLLSKRPFRLLISNKSTGEHHVVDENGSFVFRIKCDRVDPNRDGYSIIVSGNSYGVIDIDGQIIIPMRPRRIKSYSDGLFPVSVDGKWGYMDITEQLAVPPLFTTADRFSEGLALVSRDGSVGYIDRQGKEVIPLKFWWGDLFSEGLAAVACEPGRLYFIDKERKVKISNTFQHCYQFFRGLSVATTDKRERRWGCIDMQGEFVLQEKYSAVAVIQPDLFFVELEDENGDPTETQYVTLGGDVIWRGDIVFLPPHMD